METSQPEENNAGGAPIDLESTQVLPKLPEDAFQQEHLKEVGLLELEEEEIPTTGIEVEEVPPGEAEHVTLSGDAPEEMERRIAPLPKSDSIEWVPPESENTVATQGSKMTPNAPDYFEWAAKQPLNKEKNPHPEEMRLISSTAPEGTWGEWKDRLTRTIVERFGGAKETISNLGESATEKFETSKAYLANRSRELGADLKTLGLDVVADFKALGRGIAHTASHPMEASKAVVGAGKRAAEYVGYFAGRETSLAEKREKLNKDVEALIQSYNKLPFRQKAYITGGLIVGSATASAMALPTLASILAKSMVGSRVLGGAGFALNRRKGMEERIAKDSDSWLANRSENFKNTYAATLGVVYSGSTYIAGHYATEKLTSWFGQLFHHPIVDAQAQPEAPVVPQQAVAETSAATAMVTEATVPAPEIPTIDIAAAHGDGYEKMLQHMWEKLQEQHLDSNNYPESSDIHKLLLADKDSIGAVAHRIAMSSEHGFYKPDGTSVVIHPDAHMTIDDSGQVRIDDSIHGVAAPEGTAVTHAPRAPEADKFPSEVTPSGHYEPVPDDSALGALVPSGAAPTPDISPAPDISHPDTTVPETPTPAADTPPHTPEVPMISHETVNKFGYAISMDDAHLYLGDKGEIFVYGGRLQEQNDAILKYLANHPHDTVYGTDVTRNYRVPFHLVNGKLVAEEKVKVRGLFGIKRLAKAPDKNDLKQIFP